MKTLVSILTVVLVLSSASLAYSYDFLYVQDPKTPWKGGWGTIESATMSVRPQGLFMEHGLYLTFSARGLGFGSLDTLEIQFMFDLPQEAIVRDLWLWVGDEIMQAIILDRWTASSIYENIVKRRRDPAILFKRGDGQYELRIFPLVGDQTRRIKLTYLAPTEWSATTVAVQTPMNLLRTSWYQLPFFSLLCWSSDRWGVPRTLEYPALPFQPRLDSSFAVFYEATVPGSAVDQDLTLTYASPMRNGVYLSYSSTASEGQYQLAVLPSAVLDIAVPRKVAVLIDYDAAKSTLSQGELLAAIRGNLHLNLAPTDSFNVLLSTLTIRQASEDWIPADSASIENTFASLGSEPLPGYSNLPPLLTAAINFVKLNGNDGILLLVADSDQLGSYQSANQLLNDVVKLMSPILPIHVVDYQDTNFSYTYFNDRYYTGNEYFYLNLTQLTGGTFGALWRGGTLAGLLSAALQAAGGLMTSFDLHTTLANGFCHSRFDLGDWRSSPYVTTPMLQVGAYNGTPAFVIELAGVYRSQPFNRTIAVDTIAATTPDTMAAIAWSGSQIRVWESGSPTNDVINQLVTLSLETRVLSQYTAFLALEPNDTIKACASCYDESQLVAVDDSSKDQKADSALVAFPNPFNAQTVITGTIPAGASRDQVRLSVYSILGQAVRTFDPGLLPSQGPFRMVWDARNDGGQVLATGTYIVVLTTPSGRQAVRLLLLR